VRCRTGPIHRPARSLVSLPLRRHRTRPTTSTCGRRSPDRRRPMTSPGRRRRIRPASSVGTTIPPSTKPPSPFTSRTSGAVPVTEPAEPARREPARITIGTDPSGMPRRPDPEAAWRRPPASPERRRHCSERRRPQFAGRRRIGSRARRRVPGARDVAAGRSDGVRHPGTRARVGGVLRARHRQGIPPRDRHRCRRVCRCPTRCVLGGRASDPDGARIRVPRRCDQLHRCRLRRSGPDAEHGDHDARHRVDRRIGFLRRTDPRLVELRSGHAMGYRHTWC
jgi:hypothetical protein